MTKIIRSVAVALVLVAGALTAWLFIRTDTSGWPVVIVVAGVTVVSQVALWVAASQVRRRPVGARLAMELAVPARSLGLAALAATLVAWLTADVLEIVEPASPGATPELKAQIKAEQAAIGVGVTAVIATLTTLLIDPIEEGGTTARLIRKRFRKAFEGDKALPEELRLSVTSVNHAVNWAGCRDRRARAAAFAEYVAR